MIIPAGYAQVNLRFIGSPLPTGAEITFGVNPSGASTPSLIAAAVEDALDTSGVLAPLSNAINVGTILVKEGPNSTGPSGEFPSLQGGGTAGNVSPPNVSAIVRKNTGIGGRHGSGRMYLPGIIETVVGDDGALASGFVSGLQTDLDEFLVALAANDAAMTLLHGDATSPYLVTSLVIQNTAATQRRRLRR